jgi:hypothetical protein
MRLLLLRGLLLPRWDGGVNSMKCCCGCSSWGYNTTHTMRERENGTQEQRSKVLVARRYTTPTLPQVQVRHSFGVRIALAADTMVWLGSRALPHPHWCDSVVTRCAASPVISAICTRPISNQGRCLASLA